MTLEQAARNLLKASRQMLSTANYSSAVGADLISAMDTMLITLAEQPVQHIEWDACKIHGSFIAGADGQITRTTCPLC